MTRENQVYNYEDHIFIHILMSGISDNLSAYEFVFKIIKKIF